MSPGQRLLLLIAVGWVVKNHRHQLVPLGWWIHDRLVNLRSREREIPKAARPDPRTRTSSVAAEWRSEALDSGRPPSLP